MSQESTRTSAYSWSEAMRRAEKQRYNTKIKVPMTAVPSVPRNFEQSTLSIHKGATAVYRDQRATDSYQIREYDDHYTIEMDQYNPEEGNPVAHAVFDAPRYTAVGLTIVGAALSG